MPYDFIKITDVDLMENTNEGTNVIVEDGGDLKRVPKSSIGAQADWNETDASNPAFILNKPTKMGGYTYYYYYNYYLYKCDDHNFNRGDTAVTQAEFEEDYCSSPILLNDGNTVCPVIAYNDEYSRLSYAYESYVQYHNLQWNA